ncbi:spermine/spermidine synthase domain-containing protein [Xanthomonas graminis]|uniref:Transferase n=1 Tax=Xanthomonas graminis pv. poae TaxID=227946 RepID=A0A199P0P4_9XANT|nr:transferase [Xanthomonas translucens]OAX54747.1 transferase [Xanthomonas translucens pv. poae]
MSAASGGNRGAGGRWATLRRLLRPDRAQTQALPPGRPYLERGWRYTSLQFKGEVTQSRMLTWWPHLLEVGYTRSMLGALLLRPEPHCIGIVGLGGGSQAKFCYRHLPQARIEAIEADADVLALRAAFHIPADDARFQALHGDGAQLLPQRRGRYDLLLLDAYDAEGIPAAMHTRGFYDECHAALTPGGVLAVNLYATDTRQHVAHLREIFGGRVLRMDEPEGDNHVVFAWTGDVQALDARATLARLPWFARWQLRPTFQRLQRALETTAWRR